MISEAQAAPKRPGGAATLGCLGGAVRLLAGLFCLPPSDWEPSEDEDKDAVFLTGLELGATGLKECFKVYG